MANKSKSKKFIDSLILSLVVGCMILIAVHQTINVIDYTVPEPTPTRKVAGPSEFIGDGEIEDEDDLGPLETPTPTP